MKCVLLILSCEKHTHYALKQKQSWLKHIPHYYHLIGSKKMCGDNRYVFDEINKIIYTNTDDDYLSLPAKVITGFLAIYQTKQVDYIFKTDVNQMLIQPDFFKILIDTLKVNNIWWTCSPFKNTYQFIIYYTSGISTRCDIRRLYLLHRTFLFTTYIGR